ncbi:MAG: hypothetical protein ACLGIN_06225, partial [Candidatus Sericytochromatia bacterium]
DLAAGLSVTQPAFLWPVVLFAVFGLVFWRLGAGKGSAWRVALALLVFGDLWIYGYHHGWRLYSQPMAAFDGLPRVAEAAGRHLGIPKAPFPFLRPASELKALGYPSTSALEKRRSLNGYDAFIPKRFQAQVPMGSDGYLDPRSVVFEDQHHALDLLSLRTVTIDREVEPPAAFAEAGRWKRLSDREGMAVYRNERALPRAWRPEAARVLPLAAIDAAVAGEAPFDPRGEALLEVAPNADLTPGSVEAWAASLNRIRFQTEGAGAGLVVVSESHDPGWRAFAEERELPVHRVDGLLLGVEVPPGAQTVELRYEPRLWRAGLAGSGLSLLLLAAWGYLARRRGWR